MSSAPSITRRRCRNHPARVAVARCPECERFFCRECVTEHHGQVICATCLQQMQTDEIEADEGAGRWSSATLRLVQCVVGLFVLWVAFYSFGQILTNLPTDFHEGRFWDTEVTP